MRRAALATTIILTLVLATSPAGAQTIDRACPPGHVPPSGFTDTAGNPHEASIDCVVWYQVTHGVDEQRYGPALIVRRDQMASFMARTLAALDAQLPPSSDQGFVDIAGNPHADAINQLAAAGIVAGTSPGHYSPGLDVRRDQMATFLVRTYEYAADALTASQGHFDDTAGNPHAENIDKAAEAGFTSGTAPRIYSPANPVRRDQMAAFIARMLNVAGPEHPQPQPEPEPEPPPPASGEFGPGTHRVGADIQPGRYRAVDVEDCYWERLSGFSGGLDDVKANDFLSGASVVVDVLPEDEGFRSSRCGTWRPVGPAASDNTQVIRDGVWVVGLDVAPGTYRSEATGRHCYWERTSGFSGEFREIIANGIDEEPMIVEVQSGDVGFKAQGCGTWTRA